LERSFLGDQHAGKEASSFSRRQKVTTTRWFSFGEGDIGNRAKEMDGRQEIGNKKKNLSRAPPL